jgi:hypothetical protein
MCAAEQYVFTYANELKAAGLYYVGITVDILNVELVISALRHKASKQNYLLSP